MPYKVSELKQIITHALLHDGTVVDLVADRVFTAHNEDPDDATISQPTCIIEFRGGQEFSSSPIARRRFFLYGYSKRSQAEAEAVYEAAKEALRRGVGHHAPPDESGDPCFDSCGYFWELDGPMEGKNPQARAWFTRGTWQAWQNG